MTRLLAPLEKLDTLLEDIIEAEDQLPPDADIADLSAEFFSALTVDTSQPLLHPSVVRKLTTYIAKVARPGKRARQNTRDSSRKATPKSSKIAISDLDTTVLGRVIRLLERSVKAGEDLDPFGALRHDNNANCEPRSPSKKAAKKKSSKVEDQRSTSKTPHIGEEVEADRDSPSAEGPSEVDLHILTRTLQAARDSVYAADCCIALLSADRLTKQVGGTFIGGGVFSLNVH